MESTISGGRQPVCSSCGTRAGTGAGACGNDRRLSRGRGGRPGAVDGDARRSELRAAAGGVRQRYQRAAIRAARAAGRPPASIHRSRAPNSTLFILIELYMY